MSKRSNGKKSSVKAKVKIKPKAYPKKKIDTVKRGGVYKPCVEIIAKINIDRPK